MTVKNVREVTMPVRSLYFRLRKQASRIAGMNVYRPARPDALFFSYIQQRPDESVLQDAPTGGTSLFEVRRGMKGDTPVLLWDVKPGNMEELLNEETDFRNAAAEYSPVPDVFCDTDTEQILRTCGNVMMNAPRSNASDELLRLVLYRLAFNEDKLLAEELPGKIALLQRNHMPLSSEAAQIIRLYLNGKCRNK